MCYSCFRLGKVLSEFLGTAHPMKNPSNKKKCPLFFFRWIIFLYFTLAFTLTGCLKGSLDVSPLDDRGKGISQTSEKKRPINQFDLSSRWEFQEEERSYTATFGKNGEGSYTWQNGKLVTTEFKDRIWSGTWHQTGNDREGGFEVLVSEDGNQAEGVWWYTRVEGRKNIPPKEYGGTYIWVRLPSSSMIKNIQEKETHPISQSFPPEPNQYQEKP